MKILYINGWSLDDPLTQRSTVPTLRALAEHSGVERIVLTTLEKLHLEDGQAEAEARLGFRHQNLTFAPFSEPKKRNLFSRALGFLQQILFLRKILRKHGCTLIIARGAVAGGCAWLVSLISGCRFIVESFEPHSRYMLESGVWSRSNPKYQVARLLEANTTRAASHIITVSDSFRRELITRRGRAEATTHTCPCVVDTDQYKFRESERTTTRESLGIQAGAIAGVYVGKFGGLYLDEKALQVFDTVFQAWDNFHLLVLTPDVEWMKSRIPANWPAHRVLIRKVAFQEVPAYLSAADFAFSLIKQIPAMRHCSPIKIGEYWAAGLPVASTQKIGDFSEVLEQTGLGVVFDIERGISSDNLERLKQLAEDETIRAQVSELAVRYRNPQMPADVYSRILHP